MLKSENLKEILKILTKAGKAILEIYHQNYDVQTKKDKSKVTEADFISNGILNNFFEKNYPNYKVISEENKNHRLTDDFTWVIDPIDGTNDFINKTGDFSIMLALLEKKVIIFSIIYLPLTEIFYYAFKGGGAYKLIGFSEESNGEKITMRINSTAVKKKIMYVSRNHFNALEKQVSEKLGVEEFIKKGSIGIKISEIAEGKGNIYINTSSKLGIWDLAPPALILEEAKGVLCDLDGEAITYTSDNFKINNGCLVAYSSNVLKEISTAYKKLRR